MMSRSDSHPYSFCDTPRSGLPRFIKFLIPILFMASDSSSGFHRVFHISLRPNKYNRESERKNKRTLWTWVSSKRKKGSFVTILCSFSCICRLSLACILRETSTKIYSECQHFFDCLPSLPPSADRPSPGLCGRLPLPIFLRQLTLCLLSDLLFLLHFQSHGRSRVQALC